MTAQDNTDDTPMNTAFRIRLHGSGEEMEVPADRSIVEVLREHGHYVLIAGERRLRAAALAGLLRFALHEGLVGLGVHQRVHRRLVGDLDDDHPGLAVGVLVDELGLRGEVGVDLHHLARHR